MFRIGFFSNLNISQGKKSTVTRKTKIPCARRYRISRFRLKIVRSVVPIIIMFVQNNTRYRTLAPPRVYSLHNNNLPFTDYTARTTYVHIYSYMLYTYIIYINIYIIDIFISYFVIFGV